MKLFARITKVDAKERMVYGRIAEEFPDSIGEVMDYKLSKPRFLEWSEDFEAATDGLSKGNVRAMHDDRKVAAGKLTEIEFLDDEKAIDVAAKIIDDNEWEKCEEGVYTGFSVGGDYGKKWKEGPYTHYEAIPGEVSLVDLPMLKTARFSMVKMDGTVEERPFKRVSREMELTISYTDEQGLRHTDESLKMPGDMEKLERIVGKLEKIAERKDADNPINRLQGRLAKADITRAERKFVETMLFLFGQDIEEKNG